jgi:transposase
VHETALIKEPGVEYDSEGRAGSTISDSVVSGLSADGGHRCACESGAFDHTTKAEPLCGLQAKVAIAAIKGERIIAQISDGHPNQVTTWKAQVEGGAADVFSTSGASQQEPAVDLKQLHAKIGELTLENDMVACYAILFFLKDRSGDAFSR